MAAFVSGIAAMILNWVTLGRLPEGCGNMKDLTLLVQERAFGFVGSDGNRRGSDEVWHELVDIVASSIDIKPEHITPDKHLIKDLGAG
jgi:hypothetical protein